MLGERNELAELAKAVDRMSIEQRDAYAELMKSVGEMTLKERDRLAGLTKALAAAANCECSQCRSCEIAAANKNCRCLICVYINLGNCDD